MKHHPSQSTHTDPVCGMELHPRTAAEALEYDGKTYYFCAGVCREAFESEPQRYIRQHRQHGIRRS